MTQTIQNVSDTAFMVAGFRALENEQPKPLFHDPLAAKLVGDHGKEILATIPRHFVGAWSVVIRTVIIDDYIRQAVAAGVDTILNLGAGLDTRPYRIELPSSLRWIEGDFPHLIELKETRLADEKPGCRLERIKLDLTDRALRRRLFSNVNARAGKILVLTEGVIPYLTNEDVAELADDLRQAKKIGFWITTISPPRPFAMARKCARASCATRPSGSIRKTGSPFSASTAGGLPRFATSRRKRTGSAVPFRCRSSCWRGSASKRCSPRARRDRMRKFAAYVLLVPE